MLKKIEEYIIV